MNKQTRIYSTLREGIIAGTHRPGDRLVISALATELDVSTVPVREAIRRLEAEGLVVYTRNAGARVAPIQQGEYLHGLAALALLEGYATAAASDAVDVADLRRRNAEMRAAMEALDIAGFAAANNAFHETIYASCPNPFLVDLLRDISERLQTIRQAVFTHVPYRGIESVREHEQLITLIASHAPRSEIEAAAREHKLTTAAAFRRALERPQPGVSPGRSQREQP